MPGSAVDDSWECVCMIVQLWKLPANCTTLTVQLCSYLYNCAASCITVQLTVKLCSFL